MREGTRRGEVQARRGLVPASSFSRACFAACSSSTASNILARRSGACGIGASVERAPKKTRRGVKTTLYTKEARIRLYHSSLPKRLSRT